MPDPEAAGAPGPRFVSPPGPVRLPVPPVRVVGPSQAGAAANNDYSQRLADRESHRWGKRTEIVQPETLLVHAWAWALTQYPASALTVWLQLTSPGDPYSFYITGDALAGDVFPDRKLFDTVRSKRRKPNVAESFAGRIRGMSSEGMVLDIGGGEIHLPPEPPQQPAATWGGGQPPPWGAPQGPPGPWNPYSAPWGAPPGGAGPWGQYGPPPPWWAQMQPPPWALGAPPQAPPPAAIAHDPVLVELWKGMQSAQAATLASSNEAQAKVAESQSKLMSTLLERALDKSSGGGGGGGSMKETFGVLRDALGLVNDLRGGGDDNKALQIVETKSGEKVFATGGKVHEGLTYGFAIKDGVTDLLKGMSRMRAGSPSQAAAAAAGGVGGSSLPPKNAQPAASPKPTTNGAAGTR